MNVFNETLQKYGADLAAIRYFDAGDPADAVDLLPYATLMGARAAGDPDLAALGGIYEWQNSPLVFLVDGGELQGDQARLNRIRRLLAMRGDAPYLGVVLPGQLTLYRVSLDNREPNGSRIHLDIPPEQEQGTFARLGNERPGLGGKDRWITDVVLKLLSASINELKSMREVISNDAISLVGRALFTRFLGDRGLLPHRLAADPYQVAILFDGSERAMQTSDWLDLTFNGDFLPLTEGLFGRLPQDAFRTLGNIMHRAPEGQFYLGWSEKWDMLDFAHIPVGVLSQAYESYLKKHAPLKQRTEGGYYTPAPIANLMVHGAFHALRRDGSAHKARILDPAAGAGIFLLTAFRQLVAERWRHDKCRPNTETLREILYTQITGFDINEAALRFAALGLYLMSIELDPKPEPVEKLKFKKLRNTVLHNFGDDSDNDISDSLGSLGDRVGQKHVGRYDLVIGNPPWAKATGLPSWNKVESAVVRIARERLSDEKLKLQLPKKLDLPFVWRAMEWAKPKGQIAFALHARLLFQQTESMPDARGALFCALNVTGIVNGADLRNSEVWPGVLAPFCLLFADNQKPPLGAGFRFVSPYAEENLNAAGSFRVDANNAELITPDQVVQQPHFLKLLFRAGRLDAEIYNSLHAGKFETLKKFWQSRFGGAGNYLKFAGNGYQKIGDSSQPKQGGDGLPGVSAAYLKGFKELTSDTAQERYVDISLLANFKEERIHRKRAQEIFFGPLLIFRETPPAQAGRIHTLVSDQNVIFNKSYNGYSAREHPDGRRLVRYLALIISSKVALWHALITSGKFGVERDVIEKVTVEDLPIPAFEALEPSDLKQIDTLFDAVVNSDEEETWVKVDDWVNALYGFRERDLEVITDTLKFNLPFSENKKVAQTNPRAEEIDAFCSTLSSELEPWAARAGRNIRTIHAQQFKASPWGIVRIVFDGQTVPRITEISNAEWTEVLRIADQMAATEILHPDHERNCLWIGRLNQARYWSRSQARLVARRIIWDHADLLAGRAAE